MTVMIRPTIPWTARLWAPVVREALDTGLTAAGVPLRDAQDALKASNPKKWRQYLLNLWRRHQHKPAVQQRSDSTLRSVPQMLTPVFADDPDLHLPSPSTIGLHNPPLADF